MPMRSGAGWQDVFTATAHDSCDLWKMFNEAWCFFSGGIKNSDLSVGAGFYDDQIAYSRTGHNHPNTAGSNKGNSLGPTALYKEAFDVNACSVVWGSFNKDSLGVRNGNDKPQYLLVATSVGLDSSGYSSGIEGAPDHMHWWAWSRPISWKSAVWYPARDESLIPGNSGWTVVAFVPCVGSMPAQSYQGNEVEWSVQNTLCGLFWYKPSTPADEVRVAMYTFGLSWPSAACRRIHGLWVLRRVV
jgi:hypothetical protein